MTFRFVQSSSASVLRVPSDRPESSLEVNPVRVLGDDYRRWSRLLVGLLGLALALFGVLATVMIPASGARLMPSDVILAAIGVPVGLSGLGVLVALHVSGRRLLRALGWWTRERFRNGSARPTAGGWVTARTVNFEPPVLARIAASGLTGLAAILALSVVAYPTPAGSPNLVPGFLVAGVLLAAVAVCLMSGVMRLVNAAAEADPLWTRIRGAFRRM